MPVRQALTDIFAELDCWFDRLQQLGKFKPSVGRWPIDQMLEHSALTNYLLMLIIRRWTEKATRKAQRGVPIPEGESDLTRLDIIGERGGFVWVRSEQWNRRRAEFRGGTRADAPAGGRVPGAADATGARGRFAVQGPHVGP